MYARLERGSPAESGGRASLEREERETSRAKRFYARASATSSTPTLSSFFDIKFRERCAPWPADPCVPRTHAIFRSFSQRSGFEISPHESVTALISAGSLQSPDEHGRSCSVKSVRIPRFVDGPKNKASRASALPPRKQKTPEMRLSHSAVRFEVLQHHLLNHQPRSRRTRPILLALHLQSVLAVRCASLVAGSLKRPKSFLA